MYLTACLCASLSLSLSPLFCGAGGAGCTGQVSRRRRRPPPSSHHRRSHPRSHLALALRRKGAVFEQVFERKSLPAFPLGRCCLCNPAVVSHKRTRMWCRPCTNAHTCSGGVVLKRVVPPVYKHVLIVAAGPSPGRSSCSRTGLRRRCPSCWRWTAAPMCGQRRPQRRPACPTSSMADPRAFLFFFFVSFLSLVLSLVLLVCFSPTALTQQLTQQRGWLGCTVAGWADGAGGRAGRAAADVRSRESVESATKEMAPALSSLHAISSLWVPAGRRHHTSLPPPPPCPCRVNTTHGAGSTRGEGRTCAYTRRAAHSRQGPFPVARPRKWPTCLSSTVSPAAVFTGAVPAPSAPCAR